MDMELFQQKLEGSVLIPKKRGRPAGSQPKVPKVKKPKVKREKKVRIKKTKPEPIAPDINLSSIVEPVEGWKIIYPKVSDQETILAMLEIKRNENTSMFFWRFKDLLIAGSRNEIVDKGNEYQFVIANIKTNKIEHRVFGSKSIFTHLPYSIDNITSEQHIKQFVQERY